MSGKAKILILIVLISSLISGFAIQDAFAENIDTTQILGGQIYASPHRSTPEEFAKRQELYRELISLRNANRQRDSITLNMSNYRAVMKKIWGNAYEIYHGNVRSIPICGELIPAEYQEPESKKEKYYKQQTELHNNFCGYAANFSKYEQLICVYFILSQEIEELQKPLLDLAPETIYTMKNLEGRMEYLRKRLPELTKTGQEMIQEETPRVSSVNLSWRMHVLSMLQDLFNVWKTEYLYVPAETLKQYNAILEVHWATASRIYGGKVDFAPTYQEILMPLEYLDSPKKAEYVKEHEVMYRNFCDYLEKLPERERLICIYIQQLAIMNRLQTPILDMKTDTPYPDDNLLKRYLAIKGMVREIENLKKQILAIEKNKLSQGEK